MNQTEKRRFLIQSLLRERPSCGRQEIPTDENQQKLLLRGLMNVRRPRPISSVFLQIQDEYLQEELRHKHITHWQELTPVQPGLYLWQGDITTLSCDAIVNAANSGMTGCYSPCHNCIDNCIHTNAGIQLRLTCSEIMAKQGCEEPTGQAKITPAYNLPCRYVLHTVGPIIQDTVQPIHRQQLASCYRACLALAVENGLSSIAFCCISTGVFRFPNREAAQIAIDTVKQFKAETGSAIEVIFNVFLEKDRAIYAELLR